MTEFNVDFELCSVLFLWMLFVISKLRKRLEGYQSPVFQIYLYLVMASNFLNVVTTYALQYHDTLPAFWNWGLNVLFLSIQMILPGVFIMYIYLIFTSTLYSIPLRRCSWLSAGVRR